jgi:hypothetical protein
VVEDPPPVDAELPVVEFAEEVADVLVVRDVQQLLPAQVEHLRTLPDGAALAATHQ